VLLLISGVVLAGGAKIYTDRQAAAIELVERRADYVELLTELQQRVSQLLQADGELNKFLGEGAELKGAKRMPDKGPVRAEFERMSEEIGKRESEILSGGGHYVPTAPAYANVHFLTLAARLERLGGVPDIQMGALRLLPVLQADPSILWIFVRAYGPMMQKFVISRHLLYTRGELPLPVGAELTERQEAVLGFPADMSDEEFEALKRRTNAHLDEVINELRGNETK
jgi:hypothetical protein